MKPRVYVRDGFVVTLWTYYESATPQEVEPADYASALARLHSGMRTLSISLRRTSRIALRMHNNSWQAATTHRRWPTRTGSSWAIRYAA